MGQLLHVRRDDLEVPAALRDIRGPVLGYEGTIWHDLDLEPLLHSAREQPDVTFVLVGRVERNPALRALEALPNVRILGWKPLVELPEYLARFDVCLNLLRRGSMEADILPPGFSSILPPGNQWSPCSSRGR